MQLIGSVVLLTEGELTNEGRPVYGPCSLEPEEITFGPAYRKIMVLMYIVHVYVDAQLSLLNVSADESSGASSTSILYVSKRQRLW